MEEKVPVVDLNAPLAVESSKEVEESETVTKSLGWFYGGTAVLIVLIIIGLGVGYLSSRQKVESSVQKVEEVKPSPSPVALDRSSLKVEVLNGSGKAGKAGEKARELEKLGYTNVKTGNADKRYPTSIVYLSEKAKTFKDDFTDIKQDVLDEEGIDIRLVLGVSQTPKP